MTTARDIYLAHPTQDEIDDVLGQRLVAALGSLNEDGSVHLAYLLFLYENGQFFLETASLTRKARCMRPIPTVSAFRSSCRRRLVRASSKDRSARWLQRLVSPHAGGTSLFS